MLTYGPDLAVLDPNVITSSTQLLPNIDGSWSAPTAAIALGVTALATGSGSGNVNPTVGAFFGKLRSGASRLFVAQQTRLKEYSSGWVDQSAGGSAYVSDNCWHFVQYGDQTIACSKLNPTQVSTTSGAFHALAGAPTARICATMSGAVLLANIVLNGVDTPDGLAISDIDNNLQWVPDLLTLSNEAYQTQLTETAGEITAMIRFRNFIVIFKKRGMWLAQYVGRPLVWNVQLFSADVGCVGKDACLVAGDLLYFAAAQSPYVFDGATIQSLLTSKTYKTIPYSMGLDAGGYVDKNPVQMHHDEINKQVTFFAFPNTLNYTANGYVYNYVSHEWGKVLVGPSNGSGLTCPVNAPPGDLGGFAAGAFQGAQDHNECYFYYNAVAQTMVAASGWGVQQAGSVVMAWSGSPAQAQQLRRIYLNIDSTTGLSVSVAARRGPAATAASQSSASGNADSSMKIDLLAAGNFFQPTYTIATTAVFTKWQDHTFDVVPSGQN